MGKLGKSLPVNVDKIKSESGSEVTGSLGVSFPTNVDKLKSEIGGGGGSGDLSEATMTVIKRGEIDWLSIEISTPQYNSSFDRELLSTGFNIGSYIPSEFEVTFVLYKGASLIKIYQEDMSGFVIEGDAELYDDEGVAYICATGDFTLIVP